MSRAVIARRARGPMPRAAAVVALPALALLAACGSAPKPTPAQLPALQPGFTHAPSGVATAEPAESFWRRFQDPLLETLVAQALAANGDVRIAASRLAETRALERVAAAGDLPGVALNAGAARARTPGEGGRPQTGNRLGLGAEVRWEWDWLAQVNGKREAAAADAEAAAALLQAARLSVAAAVAREYFELRGLQERLRLARESLHLQRQALTLVQARLDAGRGTALDTERARALVLATEASVPALETQLVVTQGRISLLLGKSPQEPADPRLAEPRPLPGMAALALGAIGTPQTLLARRPDVMAAMRSAEAAAARQGEAWKARWPALGFGGTLGLNAGRVGDLGRSASFVYDLGASLVWSVFDAGARGALTEAAGAREQAAVIGYEQTVLAALAETEAVFAGYTRLQQQAASLFGAAEAAEKAAVIAQGRFGAGVSDFLAVLDAERERVAARERLVLAQTAAAQSVVAIYKALGGGV